MPHIGRRNGGWRLRVTMTTQKDSDIFTTLDSLLEHLGLSPGECPYRLGRGAGQPMLVPVSLAKRMRRRDWHDRILLQVLPRGEEEIARRGFCGDPVGDRDSIVIPGLLHKYRTRVLVMTTGACAMHCRYCFRRQLPERGGPLGREARERLCRYVGEHTDITEVILSGGDPFMLDCGALRDIVKPLLHCEHVCTIRFHTRVPVARPSIIGDEMCGLVSDIAARRSCIVVVHANCAQEIGAGCRESLRRLRGAGAVLLNQSVLLKGVNDSADELERLCRELVDAGVLPYYLHQLDRVQGAWHFEVPIDVGCGLVRELRARLPGYAVPRYVRDTPGGLSKEVLG